MEKRNLLRMYDLMVRTRRFEERCQQLVDSGKFMPHFHAGTGQEALSVAGVCALHEDDYLLYTHRGYGHLIARGVPINLLMADLYSKSGGTNNGMGSIMHVVYPEKGILGRNGVFGARFSIAAGMALASKLKGTRQVVAAFYGEAEGNRGTFFEALNFMTIWKLPVVLIAENNGFSISARQTSIYPSERMADMGMGFGIPCVTVDGNDPIAVFQAVSDALNRARGGEGPSLVEGKTYRIAVHRPHDDDTKYRSREEVEQWRRRDPLLLYKQKLYDMGVLDSEYESSLERRVEEEVSKSVKYADACGDPDPRMLFGNLYYSGECV